MQRTPPQDSQRPQPTVSQHRRAWQQMRISIAPSTIWLAIGGAVTAILLLHFLQSILEVLFLLFAAITLGEAMRPAVRWMHRYHVPRWLGVLLLYLAALGTLGGLGYLMSRPLLSQANQFARHLPGYLQQLESAAQRIQGGLNDLPGGSAIPDQLGNLLGQAGPLLLNIPAAILSAITGIIIILFMALFWVAFTDGLRAFFLGCFPPRLRSTGAQVLDEMSIRLGGYVRGVLINMVVVGMLSGIAVWLLGLPFALLLAVFAGLTEAIPLVGPWIGAIPAVLLGFSISPTTGLLVILAYLLIQQLENHTLVPLVMNRTVKLSPLTTLVAVTIGALLQGLLGVLLAVPLAAVVQVLVVRVLVPWIRRTTDRDTQEMAEQETAPSAQQEQAQDEEHTAAA
ncbi:MAG TPA: AI-2E family transporter [Ktedonobacterales bacterium]|nr:AI-2E family transporter [Ktedonobacterales bacterium]